MPPLRIVTVGDITTEFDAASEYLKSIRPAEHKSVLQLSSLVRGLESGHSSYDLIVVFQNRPDEFGRAEVDQLIATASLSRLVCICSSWCESDGRTRDIWPLAVRVPTERAVKRLQQEVEVLRGQREPLPVTASRDETFRFDFDQRLLNSKPSTERFVCVISPDRNYRQTLTALLASSFESVHDFANVAEFGESINQQDSPAIVLLDIDPCSESLLQQIDLLKESTGDGEFYAICNYPRIQDRSRFAELGFTDVLPKLISADELLSSLRVA